MVTALYSGSFDPPTNGHMDILRQALALADRVVVAIGTHAGKTPLLDKTARIGLIKACIAEFEGSAGGQRVDVIAFSGLVVEAARAADARLIVRGLRDSADLDDELRMSAMNRALAPEIMTVFLPATPQYRAISATLIRQIHAMNGDISPFVPAAVRDAMDMNRRHGG